jgi:acyl-CoA reductase-like NAD-dependent aldehyde dehydrogenase
VPSTTPPAERPDSWASLDATVATLRRKRQGWAALSAGERLPFLDEAIQGVAIAAADWVEASHWGKRAEPDDHFALAHEWAAGPYVVIRYLRRLRETLEALATDDRAAGVRLRTTADGRVVARVFPQSAYDRLFFSGTTSDVVMQPGVALEQVVADRAASYPRGDASARQENSSALGRVTLVLGAGNVSGMGAGDAMQKLFADGSVVVLKMNPINAYLTPHLERAFAGLIARGFLRIVQGGAAEGRYLCHHPWVDAVHLTGSEKTFAAIMFGGGAEGAANKAARRPVLTKPVTAELGNVGPVIVVPGPWSAKDLAYHARLIVATALDNGGCSCTAANVIVQHDRWGLRTRLLDEIRAVMATVPSRETFYPGAADRHRAFLAAHPESERFGGDGNGALPWLLIPDVEAARTGDPSFAIEPFCGVLSETALAGIDTPAFLDRAVDWVNDNVRGSLCAQLLIHPRSLADRAIAAAYQRALDRLRYGTIAVNHQPAAGWILGVNAWGSFPGQTVEDPQSGIGFTQNALMFAAPEKNIVSGPFRMRPAPVWFPDRGRAGVDAFRRLVAFEATGDRTAVPGIAWAAVRR